MFLKKQSKWWDGYNGERVVYLEDYDTETLGHYLKEWADRWPCTGEFKSGTLPLSHELFIVTSNYSIRDLFVTRGKWVQTERGI